MAYTKKVWKDAPDTSTPINAANLNHMEDGIAEADANATAALDGLDDKQNSTDYTLLTVAKTIVGAINELLDKVLTHQQAITGLEGSLNSTTQSLQQQINTKTNTKVKGNAETSYRTGNVNLTPANIGAFNKAGDAITGGWLDMYTNGVQRTSFYCNTGDGTTNLFARTGDIYMFTNGNGLGVKKTNNSWNNIYGIIQNVSSELVKENIIEVTDEEGLKVLDLNPIHYDYAEWYSDQKDQLGLIAEEVLKVFPEVVNIPEGYDENAIDKEKGTNNKVLSINYTGLIPPLIKLCQIQQEQIDALTKRVEELESKL